MSILSYTTTKVESCNVGLVKTDTIWCPIWFSLQLQKKYSAMEGLTKRAPFDVRFDFHYNYKSIEFCNNGGLVQTGTIWCPFWFSQLQK